VWSSECGRCFPGGRFGEPGTGVDDLVYSGWTFTDVGVALRTGSGPAFPIALAAAVSK